MIITVRKFIPSSDADLLEFIDGCTTIHTSSSHITVPFGSNEFKTMFYPDGIWLALDGDAAIGVILFGRCNTDRHSCAAVYWIQVDEQYRRRGIGGMLMHKADLYTKTVGIDRLILHTRTDNKPALILFSKCWFRIIESSPEKLTMEKTGEKSHVYRTKIT